MFWFFINLYTYVVWPLWADISLFLFNLIFEKYILDIFLMIITIIIWCSKMFRNIPCSMFHVPDILTIHVNNMFGLWNVWQILNTFQA